MPTTCTSSASASERCARHTPYRLRLNSPLSTTKSTSPFRTFPTAILLLAKDGVRLIDLHQCRFGSWALKPSSLICWGEGWGTEGLKCNHQWELTGRYRRDGEPIWAPPHSSSLTLKYEN